MPGPNRTLAAVSLALALFLAPFPGQAFGESVATEWEARFDAPYPRGSAAYCVRTDPGGNIYVAAGIGGLTLIKYDPAGSIVWETRTGVSATPLDLIVDAAGNLYVGCSGGSGYMTVTFGPDGVERWRDFYTEQVHAMAAMGVDSAGNVYVTGSTVRSEYVPPATHYYYSYTTVKYDAGGARCWVRDFSPAGSTHNSPADLALDAAGNVYVTGEGNTEENWMSDLVTVKYDPDGNEAWVARYDGPGGHDERAEALFVDAGGSVWVTGTGYRAESGVDYLTVKYGPDGVEQWTARYGAPGDDADRPRALAVDAWGNAYVAGESPSETSGLDYLTVKYGPDGEELWTARLDGPSGGVDTDTATDLAVDDHGNVHVTGESGEEFATVKYDADGNKVWEQRYPSTGGSYAGDTQRMALDPSGAVVVAGMSGMVAAVLKYDADGVRLWANRYVQPEEGSGADRLASLAADPWGNVVVAGTKSFHTPDSSFLTVKYDTAGNQLWTARYDGPGFARDKLVDLAVDDAGCIYVTGASTGAGTWSDWATVKYSPLGAESWVARYDGAGYEFNEPAAMAVDALGNVYVTGWTRKADMNTDAVTVKYGGAGTRLWVAEYDGPSGREDVPVAVAVDSSGNVFVAASSEADILTIKYGPDGTRLWAAQYNGPGDGSDGPAGIAVDGSGNVLVTGHVHAGDHLEMVTIRYDTDGNTIWAAPYGGAEDSCWSAALVVDDSGNVVVTGQGSDGYLTVKYAPGGTRLWAASYSGPPLLGSDRPAAIAADAGGNVYVTGSSVGRIEWHQGFPIEYWDYATVKYSPEGRQLWAVRYDTAQSENDNAAGIALDASGHVFVGGTSSLSGTGYDYLTLKYTQAAEWEAAPEAARKTQLRRREAKKTLSERRRCSVFDPEAYREYVEGAETPSEPCSQGISSRGRRLLRFPDFSVPARPRPARPARWRPPPGPAGARPGRRRP